MYHLPVLLKESVDGLNIRPDGVYVDVTFGGGGHSREIISRLGEKGQLFAFDQDKDALKNAIDDPRFTLINQNFRYIKNYLRLHKITQVDGIIADLGVSSHQFDTAGRGFSIREDGPLDMRMNPEGTLSAHDIVNDYEQEALSSVFYKYGELRENRAVASKILKHRPINTTMELINVLKGFAPQARENKFFAQVFQALRIEANDEMGALEEFLLQSGQLLSPEGRLSVISYHSLEDRLVKNYIRSGNFDGEVEKDFYGNALCPVKAVNRKVIVPTEEEMAVNNRSRSAKLRIAEKI